VVWKDAKVQVTIGDLRCKLFRSCPSFAVVLTAIEAAAAGVRPIDALRYCVSCKTDAKTVLSRLIKCVEVRGDEYLFVATDRDGRELRLIYEDLDEAFGNFNQFFTEHHHFAIDDSHFVDINYGAVMLTHHRLYHLVRALERRGEEGAAVRCRVLYGGARRLDKIPAGSVDLVATHPPYFGLVGDTRIKRHYVPTTHYVLLALLDAGFALKEEVIKMQHNMKTTREVWRRRKERDFLLIRHEKLYILEKRKDAVPKYSTKQPFIELKISPWLYSK
jgi:hypothetical protein